MQRSRDSVGFTLLFVVWVVEDLRDGYVGKAPRFYYPTPLHNTMNQALDMKESILYNKYGICITSSILRKGPSEYPSRDIRGVRLVEREKNKTLPVLLSTAGILLIAFKLYLPGVALLAAGLAWFLRTQDDFWSW